MALFLLLYVVGWLLSFVRVVVICLLLFVFGVEFLYVVFVIVCCCVACCCL